MSEQQEIWETYASAWKAETAEEKKARFVEALAPECVYTDPLHQAHGWDELTAYMLDFHQQVPGGHFVTRWFSAHHGRSVARWDMVAGDGTVLGEGISYGTYGNDGKLTAMTGFWDTGE